MLTVKNMWSEIVNPNMYLLVKQMWSNSEVVEKFPLVLPKALRSLGKPMLVLVCSSQTGQVHVVLCW